MVFLFKKNKNLTTLADKFKNNLNHLYYLVVFSSLKNELINFKKINSFVNEINANNMLKDKKSEDVND